MSLNRCVRLNFTFALLATSVLFGGCASLPTSGPTAGQIVKSVGSSENTIGMKIVDIDPAMIASVQNSTSVADSRVATIASIGGQAHNDAVGPGDVLAINLYEVGASLFGYERSSGGQFDPSARSELFPAITVGQNGTIKLPYVGALQVNGRTPPEIQAMIERAYKGKSQSPQALVVVKENVSEAVYVTGDVHKPGRIPLTLQNERLLDAIATAGGAVTQTQDMLVRFARNGEHIEERLDRIHAGAADDLMLVAGDRIELLREPQTFTVFGAAGKVTQVPFDQRDLTLMEAVARAGGPNDASANPKAVFLFRYDPSPEQGGKAIPIIYRLNMMTPQSYFLSQNFRVRNKDVLYLSNAAINRASKFVGIINSLFSPFVAARAVSQ